MPVPVFVAFMIVALLLGGCARPYQSEPLYQPGTKIPYYGTGDQGAFNRTFQNGMEHNRSGVLMTWYNTRTNNFGTVTPLAAFNAQNGVVCREFMTMFSSPRQGKEFRAVGVGCRDPKFGIWHVSLGNGEFATVDYDDDPRYSINGGNKNGWFGINQY